MSKQELLEAQEQEQVPNINITFIYKAVQHNKLCKKKQMATIMQTM
jgi:hypothetical protein